MKDLSYLNMYRDKSWDNDPSMDKTQNGVFDFVVDGQHCFVIATNGEGWDHISVSCPYNVLPTWDMMEKIKRRFFNDVDFAVEYHPKKEDYVNNVENCLHLWLPNNGEEIPYPDMKAIKRSKPQVKSKKLYMVDGKPFSCILSATDNYEFLTIQGGFNKRPDWNSVCQIKQAIFGDTLAVSYHGKKGDSLTKLTTEQVDSIILWKPVGINMPTPPSILVGIKDVTQQTLEDIALSGGIEALNKFFDKAIEKDEQQRKQKDDFDHLK